MKIQVVSDLHTAVLVIFFIKRLYDFPGLRETNGVRGKLFLILESIEL